MRPATDHTAYSSVEDPSFGLPVEEGTRGSNNTYGFCSFLIRQGLTFDVFVQYMDGVLNLKIAKLGFLSSLPYLAMWLVAIIGGQISDLLRDRGVKTVVVRKVNQCIGQAISAVSIIGVGFVSSHTMASATF